MSKMVLTEVRLAFANIWEPKAIGTNANAEPRCSASLLIDPKTQGAIMDAVKAKIKEVAVEKWGVKAADVLKSLAAKGDLCLHNGDTKADYEGFSGMWFVSASNPTRPVVVDRDKSPLTRADGKPYSGCYVNANVDIWAQDNQFGKRINAKLLAIQFVKDGESFSGGEAHDDDDFGVVGGAATGGGAEGDDPFGSNDDNFFG